MVTKQGLAWLGLVELSVGLIYSLPYLKLCTGHSISGWEVLCSKAFVWNIRLTLLASTLNETIVYLTRTEKGTLRYQLKIQYFHYIFKQDKAFKIYRLSLQQASPNVKGLYAFSLLNCTTISAWIKYLVM